MAEMVKSVLKVKTTSRNQMVDITRRVEAVVGGGFFDGFVIVYVPHTTAGITIQENADPDVQHDLLRKLATLVPKDEDYYQHNEGNSDSHVKTAMVGNNVQVIVEQSRLTLGQWQGVYLCEFDGPRERTVIVQGFNYALPRD